MNKLSIQLLKQGSVQCLPDGLLDKKCALSRPLRVKFGADPTAPDLHLGHAVALRKVRQFQDAGHDVIFLIGDFTARIGDPTGRSKTRPPLSPEEIVANTKTYLEQVGRILNIDTLIVRYNSEWLSPLSPEDIISLFSNITVARLIEREDFAKRLNENKPVSMHELFYPVFQGYDSVALKADVEIGGTDQLFNLMCGRLLQEHYGQEPQVVLTMPLLEGLDGVQKMSKSLGNAIGLTESAVQVYGKLMSISDTLMWRYAELLQVVSIDRINELQDDVKHDRKHPMRVKKDIAHAIVSAVWSPQGADEGQKAFEAVFEQKDYSQATQITLPEKTPETVWIVDLLRLLGAVHSSSEAKRLIHSHAVSIDGHVIADFKAHIPWNRGMSVRVGKHRIYTIS